MMWTHSSTLSNLIIIWNKCWCSLVRMLFRGDDDLDILRLGFLKPRGYPKVIFKFDPISLNLLKLRFNEPSNATLSNLITI